ncbi:MAG: hypothetical protein AB7S69_08790 [Salinivirgaceae bacterium]
MYKNGLLIKLLFVGVLFSSCADDEAVYKIGDRFVNEESKIHFVDTLTVNVSTVRIDSFVVSGYNTVLVGYNNDPLLGTSEAKTYIEFIPSTSIPSLDDNAIFDSLVIYLQQTEDYVGDTIPLKTLAVHEVMETIEPKDDNTYIYNTDTFSINSTPLATYSFKHRPKALREEFVRLPDKLGLKWFSWLVNVNDTITDGTIFKKQFPGLALLPVTKDLSWSSSFFGYNTDATALNNNIQLRLYYRIRGQEDNTYFSFSSSEAGRVFTNFKIDYSGSILDGIENTDVIDSKNSNNLMAVQAGGGLGFRIDIPLIDNLKEIHPDISFLNARLIVKPRKGTFDKASELPQLNVYWMDSKNQIRGQLTNFTSNPIVSALTADNEFNENTYYSFDMISFILNKVNQLNPDQSLFFTLSNQDNATSFKQVILEDQSFSESLQLQLYYVVY